MTIALLALACFSPVSAEAASAAPNISSALPANARLLAALPLPNHTQVEAVTYSTTSAFVGVVSVLNGKPRLLWSHSLPIAPAGLVAVGSAGIFLGHGSEAGTHRGEVFAFRVAGNSVQSAIAHHRTGIVVSDEGVKIKPSGFVVQRRDSSHSGSIPYRLLRTFTLQSNLYTPGLTTRRPDMPAAQYPVPNGVITSNGNVILLRLEVADTEQERETGLMNRTQLDADSGMIFVWSGDVLESFWMENTLIPLTVAFLSANGTIQEMQDMQPETTDLHQPALPYRYAIEVNLGFFARNGIKVGDQVELNLGNAA